MAAGRPASELLERSSRRLEQAGFCEAAVLGDRAPRALGYGRGGDRAEMLEAGETRIGRGR